MKALPLEQKQLLDLQRIDLAIARIRHQEKSHPALVTLAALRGRQEDLRRAVVASQADLAGYQRQIEQLEGEVGKVRARQTLQQSRLDEGKVPLRDMSALEHEIASIKQRAERLEGEVLQVMETAERLQEAIAASEQSALLIGADEAKAQAEVDADLLVSRARATELEAERESVRSHISEPVLALYDRLQTRLGTLVVIEMRDGQSVGSPVEFAMAEISEMHVADADELYVSDETEYIVVRTTS